MSASDWESRLAAHLGCPVRVTYGRSRTTPLLVEQDRGPVRVHMHAFFGDAPDEVREAVASWMRVGRRARNACLLLDRWIDARLAELPPRPARKVALRTVGKTHDLDPLADSLGANEFVLDFEGDRAWPHITWGRRGRSRARRSLMLGSYQPKNNLVRIHPVLDRSFVPDWFVRYILFHEILHAALPGPKACHGGTLHHGPEFRERERTYADYERAVAWQGAHLGRLIRSARRGDYR